IAQAVELQDREIDRVAAVRLERRSRFRPERNHDRSIPFDRWNLARTGDLDRRRRELAHDLIARAVRADDASERLRKLRELRDLRADDAVRQLAVDVQISQQAPPARPGPQRAPEIPRDGIDGDGERGAAKNEVLAADANGGRGPRPAEGAGALDVFDGQSQG